MMLLFYLFVLLTPNVAACGWPTPSVIFPSNLVRLDSPLFHERRRLTAITITDARASNEASPDGVSVPPSPTSHTLVHDGGLDHQGSVQYSVVFDGSLSVQSLEYRLKSITPLDVGPSILTGTTTLVNIDHTLADAIKFEDTLIVTLSAWSSCLPTRALSESSYRFDVAASYKLFYNYTNQLGPNDDANLVSVQVPHSNATHTWVQTPCMESFLSSSLQVFNTDLHTQVFPNLRVNSPHTHRCHFKDHHQGNVCTVVARARFEYGPVCSRPITFSLRQSVSQIFQQHYNWQPTTDRPPDFNASHRLPVPDGLDMRYDLCEARVCSGSGCTPIAVQNDAFASAVHINLNQTHLSRRGVLETECRFDVIAFTDGMLSPWLRFRQSVGFELHQPLDVPPTYSFQHDRRRHLRLATNGD